MFVGHSSVPSAMLNGFRILAGNWFWWRIAMWWIGSKGRETKGVCQGSNVHFVVVWLDVWVVRLVSLFGYLVWLVGCLAGWLFEFVSPHRNQLYQSNTCDWEGDTLPIWCRARRNRLWLKLVIVDNSLYCPSLWLTTVKQWLGLAYGSWWSIVSNDDWHGWSFFGVLRATSRLMIENQKWVETYGDPYVEMINQQYLCFIFTADDSG